MNKEILRLSIPNIITNITVPLLGLVDTSIVGHLDSSLYIGAIAIATMIFNFIYWNFSFLRMGTSGFTAQAFGAGNMEECVKVLIRSLGVAFVAGGILILLQAPILAVAFRLVDTSGETAQYVKEYFSVYIWAAPASLGMYAFSGWFIGMQNARTPMYISIGTNVVNIALSLFFVYGLNMQLKGVALGSALAQVFAFTASAIIWRYKYASLRQCVIFRKVWSVCVFRSYFRVNRDIFLRSLALILVTTFFTSASTKEGETILAANTLLMQLFILFSYMMDGFAYAAEALTGKFMGAKNWIKLNFLIKRLFGWGIGLTLLFTTLYFFLATPILHLLTDKVEVIATAESYRLWCLLFPVAGFAAFLWDGIFIGMTASRQMRNSMFAAFLFFFAAYYLLQPIYGNNGLWFSFVLYLAVRGIGQTLLFFPLYRRTITR